MLTQTLLFPVLALAAFAYASPIEARDHTVTKTQTITRTTTATAIPTPTAPTDTTCPQPGGVYFAIPSKHFLYGLSCNTQYTTDGGITPGGRVNNVLACAIACDNFTNNTPNQLCFAATFHPGTAKGANNCELFTNALNGETAIIPIDSNGVESVVVTRTKVTNIQS